MGGFLPQGVGARRHRNFSPGLWVTAIASATCTGKGRMEAPSALYHLGVSVLGSEGLPEAQPSRRGRCVNKPEYWRMNWAMCDKGEPSSRC